MSEEKGRDGLTLKDESRNADIDEDNLKSQHNSDFKQESAFKNKMRNTTGAEDGFYNHHNNNRKKHSQ